MEAIVMFIIFLAVNLILLFMIIKKKAIFDPLTLMDKDGHRITVTGPGEIKKKLP